MSNDIPDWAMIKAHDLAYPDDVDWSDERKLDHMVSVSSDKAFARYIAEHEEPPVDPLLIEARGILAAHGEAMDYVDSHAAAYREGAGDDREEMTIALAALRRGIELGEAK